MTDQLLDVRSPLPAELRASLAAVSDDGGSWSSGPDLTGDALDDVGFYRIDD